MTTRIQSWRKKKSLFLLPLGFLMLAVSISSAANEPIIPYCDGIVCVDASDCGVKCVCNINENVCLDNTQAN